MLQIGVCHILSCNHKRLPLDSMNLCPGQILHAASCKLFDLRPKQTDKTGEVKQEGKKGEKKMENHTQQWQQIC